MLGSKGETNRLKRKRGDEDSDSKAVSAPSPLPLTFAALQQLSEENYRRELAQYEEYQRKRPRLRHDLRSQRRKSGKIYKAEAFVKYYKDYGALRRYARAGGPDMTDISKNGLFGGYREPERQDPLVVSETENTAHSRCSAHTDPALFMANLGAQDIKLQNIFRQENPKQQEAKLRNYKEIMDALEKPRDMSDIPEGRCLQTLIRMRDFPLEKPFCDGIMPILAGKPDPALIALAKDVGWDFFSPAGPLTLFDTEVFYSEASKMAALKNKDARADFVWGSHPSLIHSEIREDLGAILDPTAKTRYHSPGAINLIFEAKGVGGHVQTWAAQVLIAGALSANTMNEIRQWHSPNKSALDGKAYSLVFSADLQCVNIYACRPYQPAGTQRTGYSILQLKTLLIADDSKDIIEAARWLRNAIDLTTKWRLDAIEAANARAVALGYVNKPFAKSKVPDILYHKGWSIDDFRNWFKQTRSCEKNLLRKRSIRALNKEAKSGSLNEESGNSAVTDLTTRLEDFDRRNPSVGEDESPGYRTVPLLRAKKAKPKASPRDKYHREKFRRELQMDDRSSVGQLSQRSVAPTDDERRDELQALQPILEKKPTKRVGGLESSKAKKKG